MNVYHKPHLRIDYEEAGQMIIQKWTGFSTSEKFREGNLRTLDLAIEKKPIRILIDLLDAGVVKTEDTDWLLKETVPVFLQNGMKYQAFIYPKDAFAQISIKTFHNFTGGAYMANFFDNEKEAREWLFSKG